jgi:hypothetical protein
MLLPAFAPKKQHEHRPNITALPNCGKPMRHAQTI